MKNEVNMSTVTKEQAQKIISELVTNLDEFRSATKAKIERLADEHGIEVYMEDDHYNGETYYPKGANPHWNESGCSWTDSDTDITQSEGQWLSSSDLCY